MISVRNSPFSPVAAGFVLAITLPLLPTHATGPGDCAALGPLSPVVGALSPAVGWLSPVVGALSPVVGALSPALGPLSPVTSCVLP